MNKMSYVKRSIITAVCIALCVVLPMAFHTVRNAGGIFLPMHIPVLLCGLICGGPLGFLCGLAGPVLSSLMTGMPPMAILPGMTVELAVYGLMTGLLMQMVHTQNTYADLYLSLIGALLTGRIVAGIAQAIIFSSGHYSMAAWATSYFVTGLPGILIQLAFIPSIVFALERARLIPVRYPKQAYTKANV
jgi:Protein of unknown function (DUF1393).